LPEVDSLLEAGPPSQHEQAAERSQDQESKLAEPDTPSSTSGARLPWLRRNWWIPAGALGAFVVELIRSGALEAELTGNNAIYTGPLPGALAIGVGVAWVVHKLFVEPRLGPQVRQTPIDKGMPGPSDDAPTAANESPNEPAWDLNAGLGLLGAGALLAATALPWSYVCNVGFDCYDRNGWDRAFWLVGASTPNVYDDDIYLPLIGIALGIVALMGLIVALAHATSHVHTWSRRAGPMTILGLVALALTAVFVLASDSNVSSGAVFAAAGGCLLLASGGLRHWIRW
jgi:hypothetical protein